MTDLQQRMENKSTKELIEILEVHQEDYTTAALQIAYSVLEERNIDDKEICRIRESSKEEFDSQKEKALLELELSEKFKKKIKKDKFSSFILAGVGLLILITLYYSISSPFRIDLTYLVQVLFKISILTIGGILFYKKHEIGWYLLNGIFISDVLFYHIQSITQLTNPFYEFSEALSYSLSYILHFEFFLGVLLILAINTKKIRLTYNIKSIYLIFLALGVGVAIEMIYESLGLLTLLPF